MYSTGIAFRLRALTTVLDSCLQDIVGPRFHCAVCPAWDSCTQCQGVTAANTGTGEHTADHIMLKVSTSTSIRRISLITLSTDTFAVGSKRSRASQSTCTREMGTRGFDNGLGGWGHPIWPIDQKLFAHQRDRLWRSCTQTAKRGDKNARSHRARPAGSRHPMPSLQRMDHGKAVPMRKLSLRAAHIQLGKLDHNPRWQGDC